MRDYGGGASGGDSGGGASGGGAGSVVSWKQRLESVPLTPAERANADTLMPQRLLNFLKTSAELELSRLEKVHADAVAARGRPIPRDAALFNFVAAAGRIESGGAGAGAGSGVGAGGGAVGTSPANRASPGKRSAPDDPHDIRKYMHGSIRRKVDKK